MHFQVYLIVKRPLTVATWLMSHSHTPPIRSTPLRSTVPRVVSLPSLAIPSSTRLISIKRRTPAWAQAWVNYHPMRTSAHTPSPKIRIRIIHSKYRKACPTISHRNTFRHRNQCSWGIMGRCPIAIILGRWIPIMLREPTKHWINKLIRVCYTSIRILIINICYLWIVQHPRTTNPSRWINSLT